MEILNSFFDKEKHSFLFDDPGYKVLALRKVYNRYRKRSIRIPWLA